MAPAAKPPGLSTAQLETRAKQAFAAAVNVTEHKLSCAPVFKQLRCELKEARRVALRVWYHDTLTQLSPHLVNEIQTARIAAAENRLPVPPGVDPCRSMLLEFLEDYRNHHQRQWMSETMIAVINTLPTNAHKLQKKDFHVLARLRALHREWPAGDESKTAVTKALKACYKHRARFDLSELDKLQRKQGVIAKPEAKRDPVYVFKRWLQHLQVGQSTDILWSRARCHQHLTALAPHIYRQVRNGHLQASNAFGALFEALNFVRSSETEDHRNFSQTIHLYIGALAPHMILEIQHLKQLGNERKGWKSYSERAASRLLSLLLDFMGDSLDLHLSNGMVGLMLVVANELPINASKWTVEDSICFGRLQQLRDTWVGLDEADQALSRQLERLENIEAASDEWIAV